MTVSVCMATYNGEQYIYTQIESILNQLSSIDEVIIVDDGSTDKTIDILNSFKDDRIKIFKNKKNCGHVYSFSRSLSFAKNEIIFMSDQDDIWCRDRIVQMQKMLIDNKVMLVTSNSYFINSDGDPILYKVDGVNSKTSTKYRQNILDIFFGKTNYFGCAMVFRRRLNALILPIPSYVESHDLWIAMAGNIMKSNLHMNEKTFYRRVHTNNASILQRPFFKKLYSRWVLLRSFIDLCIRLKKRNKYFSDILKFYDI